MQNLSPYIVVFVLSFFTAQLMKFSIEAFKGNIDFKLFYQSGGMPSSHTTIVTSMLATIGLLQGFNSSVFGLALVITTIVIYDALGVRRATGMQADLLEKIALKMELDDDGIDSRLSHGHTPPEVAAGAALGALLGISYNYAYIADSLQFFINQPSQTEKTIYFVVFIALAVIGLISTVRYRSGVHKKLPTASSLSRLIRWSIVLPAVIGVVLGFFQFESVSSVNMRIWPLLLLLLIVAIQIVSWFRIYRKFSKKIDQEKKHFLKTQVKAKKKSKKKRKKRR